MTAKALGLIEAIGLTAAIEAADAAAKAANVTVLGYDNARGGGLITVKLVGDVGAVKAAVSAGSAAGQRVGRIAACLVIPRPHEEITALVAQITRGQVVGPAVPAPVAASPAAPAPDIALAEPSDELMSHPAAIEPAAEEAGLAPFEPVAAEAGPDGAAAPTAAPSAEAPEKRKPAPVKRGRGPKGEVPATPDTGEVEG